MNRGWLVVAAAVFGTAAGVAGLLTPRPAAPDWQAIAWPFPRDAWPAGLAFACARAACGADLRLYLRPKRGFCANCATGVTDDAEVDGVADLDMVSDDFAPIAAGQSVTIGAFVGRERAYTVPSGGGRLPVLGLAMTKPQQCDLVVAVATGAADARALQSVTGLLRSEPVVAWIDRQLDGR